jgi:pimeloyl-ACP methyl ester carboxylesterase
VPLILIHGLGDEADSWRHLIPVLKEKRRVLALDLPGFGRSVFSGRINIKTHIQAVLLLLEQTGPAVLVGNSLGAIIAEGAAMARPDLARGLILVDGCFPSKVPLNSSLLFLALPFLGKAWYRGFRKNHEGAYRSLFPYYADLEALDEADREFLRERVIERVESKTQERAYFASLRSMIWHYRFAGKGYTRFIKTYPGKVLILWGEADQVLPLDSTGIILDISPNARLAVIPGAGHLPQQEKPADTAREILNF